MSSYVVTTSYLLVNKTKHHSSQHLIYFDCVLWTVLNNVLRSIWKENLASNGLKAMTQAIYFFPTLSWPPPSLSLTRYLHELQSSGDNLLLIYLYIACIKQEKNTLKLHLCNETNSSELYMYIMRNQSTRLLVEEKSFLSSPPLFFLCSTIHANCLNVFPLPHLLF